MKKEFTINTPKGIRTFSLSALVPGQGVQLKKYLGITSESLNRQVYADLMNDLERLFIFFAILVHEDGVELEDKDVMKLANFFLFHLDTDKAKEFILFFSENLSVILKDSPKGKMNTQKIQRKKFLSKKK